MNILNHQVMKKNLLICHLIAEFMFLV